LILNTENNLQDYLDKWKSRWTSPKIKEKMFKLIEDADTPQKLAQVLIQLNAHFAYAETVTKRKRGFAPEGGEQPVAG